MGVGVLVGGFGVAVLVGFGVWVRVADGLSVLIAVGELSVPGVS